MSSGRIVLLFLGGIAIFLLLGKMFEGVGP